MVMGIFVKRHFGEKVDDSATLQLMQKSILIGEMFFCPIVAEPAVA